MENLKLFSIVFMIYFVHVVLHFILCYKMLKYENKISRFGEFIQKGNSAYPLMFQILFRKKIVKNKIITKLFILNIFFAIICFVVLLISVFLG